MIFSKTSKSKLATCHIKLQSLFNEVIKYYDCTIIQGYRTPYEQQTLYDQGKSLTLTSKHTTTPSKAIDVAPYPINWKNTKSFYHFTGFVFAIATQLNINLRTGADWNQNNNLDDQTFNDLIHFEICGE